MKHTKSYIPGHPNPQFTRKDFLNLDGAWDLIFDDKNEGIRKKYYQGFNAQHQIIVPYTYEFRASGIIEEQTHNILWYHKSFQVNELNKSTLLHFEGVDYIADVYLNGQYLGHHVGGYSRFSFDITPYLVLGENHITVRVYDDYSCTHPRGKQRWMDHNYECFYKETTGIWKSVWLEHVSSTYLKTIYIRPSYEKNNVEIEYVIEGKLNNYDIETIITFKDKVIAKNTQKLLRSTFISSFDLTSDDATMKLFCWYPDYPNLYDVEFNLYENGALVDTVLSYFGVSEFISRGNAIYLNRSITFPRLILDQGYHEEYGQSLPESQLIEDIVLMKDIGFNGCRKHQKIESDLFYYYCDILGYYLWQELPSAYEWKLSTISSLQEEWVQILYQHLNHPCIMSHVIINESWGAMAIGTRIDQQDFTKGMYYLTKSIDPYRFVISNDGWEHTLSDLITIHDYEASKEIISESYRDISSNFLLDHRRVFQNSKRPSADNHTFDQKPILMTEFAGIAFSKDQDIGWGYGNLVKDEEEYLARFQGQIEAIVESKIFTGFCVTQLSDVYQEMNGLVDANRNYKVNKERLKAIISKKF